MQRRTKESVKAKKQPINLVKRKEALTTYYAEIIPVTEGQSIICCCGSRDRGVALKAANPLKSLILKPYLTKT